MKLIEESLVLLAIVSSYAASANPIPFGANGKCEANLAPKDYGDYGGHGSYPPPPPAPTSYGLYSNHMKYDRDAMAEPADLAKERNAEPLQRPLQKLLQLAMAPVANTVHVRMELISRQANWMCNLLVVGSTASLILICSLLIDSELSISSVSLDNETSE